MGLGLERQGWEDQFGNAHFKRFDSSGFSWGRRRGRVYLTLYSFAGGRRDRYRL